MIQQKLFRPPLLDVVANFCPYLILQCERPDNMPKEIEFFRVKSFGFRMIFRLWKSVSRSDGHSFIATTLCFWNCIFMNFSRRSKGYVQNFRHKFNLFPYRMNAKSDTDKNPKKHHVLERIFVSEFSTERRIFDFCSKWKVVFKNPQFSHIRR